MVSHVPVWVFPLLAVLILAGLRLRMARDVAPRVVIGLALGMASLSLWGVASAFPSSPLPLLAWLAGMAVAVGVGRGMLTPRGLRVVSGSGRVHVPGSWLPMGLMLGIFAIKFGLGMAAGLGHPVAGTSAAAAVVALALGVLSGGFAARAVSVVRVARRAAQGA